MIDVCITVYGKPWQTLLALKSLLEYSSGEVDTIYYCEEEVQPSDYDYDIISTYLPFKKVIRYIIPKRPDDRRLGYSTIEEAMASGVKTHSLRYQYGLEMSNKKWMLLIHNDIHFFDNIVPQMLKEEKFDTFCIGNIGQCWRCPFGYHGIDICVGSRLHENIASSTSAILDPESLKKIYLDGVCGLNLDHYTLFMSRLNAAKPFPCIECRVNEWCAAINLELYRSQILGTIGAPLIGGYFGGGDIGAAWFNYMCNAGYSFVDFDIYAYLAHGGGQVKNESDLELSDFRPGNLGAGHPALSDSSIYEYGEARAKFFLRNYYKLDV